MITSTSPLPWHLKCPVSQQPLTYAVILSPCGHEVHESCLNTAKTASGSQQCPVSGCPHGVESYQKNEHKSLSTQKYLETYEDSRTFLATLIPYVMSYPGIRGQFGGDGLILQSHNGSAIQMIFLARKENFYLVLGQKEEGNDFCLFLLANKILYRKFQPNGIDYNVEIHDVPSLKRLINILYHENDLPNNYAEYLLSTIK